MRKKYRRDYIILEPKDLSFRLKEKLVPKAFAKIEFKDDKTSCMIYVENLKYIKTGYRIFLVDSQLSSKDVGRVLVNESGKGEFSLNINEDIEVKAVAITHEKDTILLGFKGSHIVEYEDLLFRGVIDTVEEVVIIEQEKEIVDETFRIEESKKKERKEREEAPSEEETFRETLEEKEEDITETHKSMLEPSFQQEELHIQEEELHVQEEELHIQEEEVHVQEEEIHLQEEINIKEINIEDKSVEDRVYLIPRNIKRHLNKHKEVIPFNESDDDIRWWKIDINPVSLYAYNIPYLGYINFVNYTFYSEISNMVYKHRHYLFGIKYCEKGKRKYYIYAIPGHRNQKPDEGNTGFIHFISCNDRMNEYGYWLCYIDCKTRLIALDEE